MFELRGGEYRSDYKQQKNNNARHRRACGCPVLFWIFSADYYNTIGQLIATQLCPSRTRTSKDRYERPDLTIESLRLVRHRPVLGGAEKRGELIQDLEAAVAMAEELGDAKPHTLIERATDKPRRSNFGCQQSCDRG